MRESDALLIAQAEIVSRLMKRATKSMQEGELPCTKLVAFCHSRLPAPTATTVAAQKNDNVVDDVVQQHDVSLSTTRCSALQSHV
jgi:hypothetical protein